MRSSIRFRIAALCAVVVLTASTLPAFALQACSVFESGEPGDLLNREIIKIQQQLSGAVKANPKQICTAKTLELVRELALAQKRFLDFQLRNLGRADCPWSDDNKSAVEYNKDSIKSTQEAVAQCESTLGVAPNSPSVVANRTGASTPYPFDCNKRPIDANVSWYYTCNPVKESAELRKAAYRHPITPQALYGKAWASCKEKPAEQQRACIDDAKLQTLLREDPNIRTKCGSYSGAQQVACVDRYYLYGPDAGSQRNLRAYLQEKFDHENRIEAALRKKHKQVLDEFYYSTAGKARLEELLDRAADYAKALNGEADVPADIEQLAQTIKPDPLTTPQQLFDRVVRASVDVAIEANKARLSEKDQRECAAAAYKIVWGTLAGNNGIKAPEKCSGVVSDAVAQLAYQAAAPFSSQSLPEEDLLKHYLALRYANTGGKNDGTLDAPFEVQGLTPGTDEKR
jgi:hypothetical protein